MTSKKLKLITLILLAATFAPSRLVAAGTTTKNSDKLPMLHYAGVIPVQWDKGSSWQDLGHVQKTIDSEFSEAVHSSHRFSMVSDELVRSLWKTPAGRKELEIDYELSVYANLDITPRGDMVVITTRLLSPKLETLLQESDVIQRSWLKEATRDQTSAKLVDLVQRMINRLPVDAHITSVTGNYVTLTGGKEQGIKVGDKFEVLSASISSFHPVNGGWLTFDVAKTGSIEVVELKSMSSIAKITSLDHDNSIKTGQGIHIESISGRSHFAQSSVTPTADPSAAEAAAATAATTAATAATKTASASGKVGSIKNKQPLGQSAVQGAGGTLTDSNATAASSPGASPTNGDSQEAPKEATPTNSITAAENNSKPAPEGGKTDKTSDPKSDAAPSDAPPETDNFTAKLMPKGSEMRAWMGMKMWSISGSASATASLPVWIVNSAGADIYRKFSDTIDYSYGADIGYGPTAKGSFFGYNIHSAARWHMYMKDVLPGADDVYLGLMASLASTSVTGETSGGYDLTMIKLNLGVHGWAKPDFIGDKVEWTGEIFYPLYYSGQFGVRGKFKSIISGSSTAFRVGAYLGDRPAQGWQYGAAFDYESNSWELQTKKSAAYGSIGILALARRSL